MGRGRALTKTLVLAVSAAIVLVMASPAWAAQFRVTKETDTNDGTCDSDCSLREAVIAANGAPGPDTITVPRGTYTLTITGAFENDAQTGDLDITDDATINGAGARSTTVAGGEGFDDRIFDVPPVIEGGSDFAEVPSDVTAEISGLTITGGNSPSFGGGVRNAGELLTLEESAVSENNATFDGGGIRNDGVFRIVRSTVSGNQSDLFGGGILNDGETSSIAPLGVIEGPGTMDLVNSTISGNTAGNSGGGVVNFNGGDISFANVTLNNNSAQLGSNFSTEGVSSGDSANVTFKNTIVANAQGGGLNCASPPGSIDSLGNNLDDDGSCGFNERSDIVGKDPRLGPLRDNGGPTNTHALRKGSPAINAGGQPFPSTDQRGVERPQGKRSDIGAYEFRQSGSGSGGGGKGKCKGQGGRGQGQSQCQNAGSGNVRT